MSLRLKLVARVRLETLRTTIAVRRAGPLDADYVVTEAVLRGAVKGLRIVVPCVYLLPVHRCPAGRPATRSMVRCAGGLTRLVSGVMRLVAGLVGLISVVASCVAHIN